MKGQTRPASQPLHGGWIAPAEMLAIPACELGDEARLCRTPLVSVLMLAYNHADYIEQAVASVIAQEAPFEIELLIGEDGSQDATRAVCEGLIDRFPETVRLIVADRNVGIEANFLRLLARARGRYCAMLEGDDYWTVPDKLTAQIALLDAHPEYSFCATRTANRRQWAPPKPSYGLPEMLRRYLIHTSSVVFRTHCVERWPCFPPVVCLDHLLFAYLGSQGECGFIDRETSYYRRHPGGVWSGASAAARLTMAARCIDAVDGWFEHRYRRELTDRELWIYEMETAPDPDSPIGGQWKFGWMVARQAMRRTFALAPGRCLRLGVAFFLLPMIIGYKRVRRGLALRRRLAYLVNTIRSSRPI